MAPPLYQSLFESILGPVMTSAQINALGAPWSSWPAKRTADMEYHWGLRREGTYEDGVLRTDGGWWDPANYYDRACIFYVMFAESGYTDTVSRDRARALAAKYLVDNSDGVGGVPGGTVWAQPYNMMNTGVALYYADTGNSFALSWLGYLADDIADVNRWYTGLFRTNTELQPNGFYKGGFDDRTGGRGLEVLLLAWLCNAPSIGNPNWGSPGGVDRPAVLRSLLNRMLSYQDADGTWRYYTHSWSATTPEWSVVYGTPNGVPPTTGTRFCKPWMAAGILMNSLELYYRVFEQDARIITSMAAQANFVFTSTNTYTGTTLWKAADQGFIYLEGPSNFSDAGNWEVGPGTAGAYGHSYDVGAKPLNGLYIPLFAMLYKYTQNQVWKDRAQLIFQGAIANNVLFSYSSTSKEVNQQHSYMYKLFPLLFGGTAAPMRMKWS